MDNNYNNEFGNVASILPLTSLPWCRVQLAELKSRLEQRHRSPSATMGYSTFGVSWSDEYDLQLRQTTSFDKFYRALMLLRNGVIFKSTLSQDEVDFLSELFNACPNWAFCCRDRFSTELAARCEEMSKETAIGFEHFARSLQRGRG